MINNVTICAISDTHGNLPSDLPKADILLIAGDVCPATDHSVSFQGKWIANNLLPWMKARILKEEFKHIAFIAGNHDFFFQDLMEINKEDTFRKTLPQNVHYLRDNLVELEGLKIWGSPWSNLFYDWAYMKDEEGLDEIYSKIPEGIDILISHGPAWGYGDCVEQVRYNSYSGKAIKPKMENLGSKSLIKHIDRIKPQFCLTGHIHSGNHNIVERVNGNNITKFACVSILDEGYKPLYKSLTISL